MSKVGRPKGFVVSPEMRAKISGTQRLRWLDRDIRLRRSEGVKRAWRDQKVRSRWIESLHKSFEARGVILIPDHLQSYAKKLRECGIKGDEYRTTIRVLGTLVHADPAPEAERLAG